MSKFEGIREDRGADDGVNISFCFPISEWGETNKQAGPQRMVNYKSPIPKTKLTRALLTDNVCDERKLNMEIDKIDVRQRKEWDKFQQQKTAFEHDQAAKRKSWRRSDELSLTRLNLPVIIPNDFNSSSSARSVKEIYRKPKASAKVNFKVPLVQVHVGEEDQKIVEYEEKIFLTRLPHIERLNTRQMNRYDNYKGSQLQLNKKALQDKRCQLLLNSLSERKSASPPKKKTASFFLTRSLTYI